MTSKHYMNDRKAREEAIKKIGNGNIIKETVVDKGHRNGPEIHKVSDTGIITIYNLQTGKMITKLIARPGQIKRYFENETIPKGLLKLAKQHREMNLNYLQEGVDPSYKERSKTNVNKCFIWNRNNFYFNYSNYNDFSFNKEKFLKKFQKSIDKIRIIIYNIDKKRERR